MQKEQMKTLLSFAVSIATFFAARCESSKSDQQSTIPDAAIAAVSSSDVIETQEHDTQPFTSSPTAFTEEPFVPTSIFRPWLNAVPTPSISPAAGSPPGPDSTPIRSSDHQPLHAGSLSNFAQRVLLSPLGL